MAIHITDSIDDLLEGFSQEVIQENSPVTSDEVELEYLQTLVDSGEATDQDEKRLSFLKNKLNKHERNN